MAYLMISFGIVILIAATEYIVTYLFKSLLLGMILPAAFVGTLVFGHVKGLLIVDSITLMFILIIAASLAASWIGGYIKGRELK